MDLDAGERAIAIELLVHNSTKERSCRNSIAEVSSKVTKEPVSPRDTAAAENFVNKSE